MHLTWLPVLSWLIFTKATLARPSNLRTGIQAPTNQAQFKNDNSNAVVERETAYGDESIRLTKRSWWEERVPYRNALIEKMHRESLQFLGNPNSPGGQLAYNKRIISLGSQGVMPKAEWRKAWKKVDWTEEDIAWIKKCMESLQRARRSDSRRHPYSSFWGHTCRSQRLRSRLDSSEKSDTSTNKLSLESPTRPGLIPGALAVPGPAAVGSGLLRFGSEALRRVGQYGQGLGGIH